MNLNTNSNDFFLNKKNIGTIFNSVAGQINVPLTDSNKQELLQMIINDMKTLNSKIDRNKLVGLGQNELITVNEGLNKKIIESVGQKLHTIGKNNSNNNNNNSPYIQRPINTNTNDRSLYNGPINNRDSNYAPVNYNDNITDQRQFNNINTRYNDDDDDLDKRYTNFLANRDNYLPGRNSDKPPTPDFSLDGSGKKKREKEQRERERERERESGNSGNSGNQQNNYNNNYNNNNQHNNYNNRPTEMMQGGNGNYDINGNRTNKEYYNSGVLSNYSSNNPLDMMAYNSDDNYMNNVNSFNTGIDPRLIEQFKEKDVDKALAEMQHIRGMAISVPNRGDPTQMTEKLNHNNSNNSNNFNNNLALPDANNNIRFTQNPIGTMSTSVNNITQNNQMQPQIPIPMQMQPQIPMQIQPQMINMMNEYRQLQEYQVQMANELKRLKDQMMTNTMPISNTNIQDYINQINNLNAEISQYKNINSLLNKQVEEIKNKSTLIDSSKLEKIEEKKKEIKLELERLREKHDSIEKLIENQTIVSEQLTQKRVEILELMNRYDYKIFGVDHDLIIKYSDMIRINEMKPIYRYNLPYKFENINQITLIDHNFNNSLFNITPYNNKLIIGEINNSETSVDKYEDINYKTYNSNGKNILDITLEPGKYDLDTIVTRLNSILNKYNIEIGYDPTKYIVQIRNKQNNSSPFQLVKDDYDIYTTLGFDVTNDLNTKFRGVRSADLKITKQIDCYMLNISKEKNYKINVQQNRIISNIIILKPKIDNLTYIDFLFIGENNRPFWQEYNDFNFTISIKGEILEDKEEYINVITTNDHKNNQKEKIEQSGIKQKVNETQQIEIDYQDNRNNNLLANINKMLM